MQSSILTKRKGGYKNEMNKGGNLAEGSVAKGSRPKDLSSILNDWTEGWKRNECRTEKFHRMIAYYLWLLADLLWRGSPSWRSLQRRTKMIRFICSLIVSSAFKHSKSHLYPVYTSKCWHRNSITKTQDKRRQTKTKMKRK